jgi:hypothetical protein
VLAALLTTFKPAQADESVTDSAAIELGVMRQDVQRHRDRGALDAFRARVGQFPTGRTRAEALEFLSLRYREGLGDHAAGGALDQQLLQEKAAPEELRESALTRRLQDTSAFGEGLPILAELAPNPVAQARVHRAKTLAWLTRASCMFPATLLAWATANLMRKQTRTRAHITADALVIVGCMLGCGALVTLRVEGGTAGPFLWLALVFALHAVITQRLKPNTQRPRQALALAGLASASMLASSYLVIALGFRWILRQ